MQPFEGGGEPGHSAEPILRAAAALPIAAVLAYEVYLPSDVRTDRLSNAIIALDPGGKIEVEWDEKKKN